MKFLIKKTPDGFIKSVNDEIRAEILTAYFLSTYSQKKWTNMQCP